MHGTRCEFRVGEYVHDCDGVVESQILDLLIFAKVDAKLVVVKRVFGFTIGLELICVMLFRL